MTTDTITNAFSGGSAAPSAQPSPAAASKFGASTIDPVNSPSHYRGRSGLQSIEITHAYRLGPDLTQAVDYILRAGRKTVDPRQDLAKAAFYLRYAAGLTGDRVFGLPGNKPLPDADAIAADFELDYERYNALGFALTPMPSREDCLYAAEWVEAAILKWQRKLSLDGSAAPPAHPSPADARQHHVAGSP